MKATLSVSMIVRDEAANIGTALENLHEFADEIVVLDTGSTDDTKRLAAERGAVIHGFVWCDDFAKARNVSLSYCTNQFVMWLDADDRIPMEDAVRLRALLETEPDWDVLYLPYMCSRSARKMRARVFRNGIGIRWIYPINEILSFPKRVRVKRDVDDICVYHTWDRAPGVHSERHLRILEMAIQQPEYQNSSYMLWHIAKEYSGLRDRTKAIHFYREAIRCADPNAGFMISRQYHGLARQLQRLGQHSQAAEELGKAALFYPNWREPYCGMADSLWKMGDPHAARVCVELARNIPRHRMTVERNELYDEQVFATRYVDRARELAEEAQTQGASELGVAEPGGFQDLGNTADEPPSEFLRIQLPLDDAQRATGAGTLVAGGDVCLAGQVQDFVSQNGCERPQRTCEEAGEPEVSASGSISGLTPAARRFTLRELSHLFQGADVALANLRCVAARVGTPVQQPSHDRVDPDLLEVLRVSGIRTVTTANEHVMDYGPEALLEQQMWLARSGIGQCGSGRSLVEATAPCYVDVAGTIVAIIGIDTEAGHAGATATTAGINLAQGRQAVLQRLAVSIAEARNRADLIVVSPHWGASWEEQPTQERVGLARSIIDLGADAVLGHSAHILHGVEVYAGCPIVYDMGSLLCDRVSESRIRLSAVFVLPFGRDGFGQLRVHPIVLDASGARLAEGKELDDICDLLERLSEPLGTAGWERDGEFMSLALRNAGAGREFARRIRLTGVP